MEDTVWIPGAQQASVERSAVCDTKFPIREYDFMRILLVPSELASVERKRVSRIVSGETGILNLYGHSNYEGYEIDAMTANYKRNQTSGVGNFVTTQTSSEEVRESQPEFLNTFRKHTGIDGVLYRAMKSMPNDDFCKFVSSLLTDVEVALADKQAVWKDNCVSIRARAQGGKFVLFCPVVQC